MFIYLAASGLSCGMHDLVPQSWIKPRTPHWECRVSATGPPGTSPRKIWRKNWKKWYGLQWYQEKLPQNQLQLNFSGWDHDMVLNKQNIVLQVKSSLQSHHRFKTGLWTHKKTSVLQNNIISVVFIVAVSVSKCLPIWYTNVFQNFSGTLVRNIKYIWIPVNELGCLFIVLGVFYI